MRGTIDRLSAELGAASSASLQSDIAAREYDALFTRSKRCTDATVTESRAHCAGLERARAMLTAAVERDRLAGELAALNVQLRAAPVREGIDPQSEAIVQALAFTGLPAQPRDVALALTLLIALVAELLTVGGRHGAAPDCHRASPQTAPRRSKPRRRPTAHPSPSRLPAPRRSSPSPPFPVSSRGW